MRWSLALRTSLQVFIELHQVAANGLIYFPDFCRLVLRKYREDESRESLNMHLFKVGRRSQVYDVFFSW